LLKLAATLINTAFRLHVDRKIDLEVLNNGISYFTGDLLNWTLVGVIKSLLQEIIQKEYVFVAPSHFLRYEINPLSTQRFFAAVL